MDDQDKPAKASDPTALIEEAKRFLEWAITEQRANRREAETDLRFLKGDHWDARVRQVRESDGRPCLTINKLPTFLHQITNDLRQNKPAIKASAVDDQADVETAEVVQGLIRHIEYDSNASACYITAGTYAAACGFGFWRLVTDYESEDSFDQCIKFDRIRNQFSVYMGPHKEVDGSDMRRCLLAVDMPRDEFRNEYPKADMTGADWMAQSGNDRAGWITDSTIRVAEYYRIECEPQKLCMLADGSVAWKDEVPEGAQVLRERDSERRKTMWYKLTATEVLEETEVPCRWIPVFAVIGSEIDINGEVTLAGVIRHARDPSYMYDLWMSSATEEVALRPKIPYIGAEGQFEGHENKWRHANQRNYPYLEYKPVTLDGQLAPAPARQPMADIPAGALQMAMHAADNVKATTGIFDASLGARGNETSGKAIVARQREGDVANYHIVDNLISAIKHCGRCIVDMIPRIYDTARIVRILGEDETPKPVAINQPVVEQSDDLQAVARVVNDLTVGKYDITVSMGPSYSTMRQEAADAMVQFGQAWPKLMDIAGDKVVRAMDWPGADDIAERIAKTIPPEIRGDEEGSEQQPQLPPEVVQAFQQLQAENQQLQQLVQEAQSGTDKERIRAEASIEVARINAVSRQDVEELKGAVAMLLQRMTPPPELAAAAMTKGPADAGLSVSTPPGSDALGEMAPSGPGPAGQPGQESMQ